MVKGKFIIHGGESDGNRITPKMRGFALFEEDRQANEQALLDGSRLLSANRTSLGEKIWIITEATDESGNRAATTILLPSEY
jgi:hypothetical protein